MKSWLLTFSEDSPTKQVLYKILFIESLMVTLAMSGSLIWGYVPDLHFREEGFITYASCLQLLIATVISGKIFTRVKNSQNNKLARNKNFWLAISLGLLFLALDDAFEIHEEMDFLIHDIFNINQTSLTNLIDDLIVGTYVLIFLAYVVIQWKNIQLYKSSFIFFQVGCVLTVIMVILDIANHSYYIPSLFTSEPAEQVTFQQWIGAFEDAAKIYAEGMFIVGIYKCRKIAKGYLKNVNF